MLRQLCDYTGQAILRVSRAVDCERREEEVCSRRDLLCLSVSVEVLLSLAHPDLCVLQEPSQ